MGGWIERVTHEVLAGGKTRQKREDGRSSELGLIEQVISHSERGDPAGRLHQKEARRLRHDGREGHPSVPRAPQSAPGRTRPAQNAALGWFRVEGDALEGMSRA